MIIGSADSLPKQMQRALQGFWTKNINFHSIFKGRTANCQTNPIHRFQNGLSMSTLSRIQEHIPTSPVVVVSKSYCPFCNRAKVSFYKYFWHFHEKLLILIFIRMSWNLLILEMTWKSMKSTMTQKWTKFKISWLNQLEHEV